VDQGAAQAQLLLHAARQLAGGTVEERCQAGGPGQLLDAPAPFGAVMAEQAAEEVDILEDRQGGIEIFTQTLRHVGDTRADGTAVGGIGHVAAQHLDLARAERAGTRDQGQQAGLADAVGADYSDHEASGHRQFHIRQRQAVAIAKADPVQSRHRAVVMGGRFSHGANAPANGPAKGWQGPSGHRPCRGDRS